MTLYTANLTLGRSPSIKTVFEAVAPNERRVWIISQDSRDGAYTLTTYRPLLGWSKEAPLWRVIDIKKAASREGLTAMIDSTILDILGFEPLKRAA